MRHDVRRSASGFVQENLGSRSRRRSALWKPSGRPVRLLRTSNGASVLALTRRTTEMARLYASYEQALTYHVR
jgi:hypothetical protein